MELQFIGIGVLVVAVSIVFEGEFACFTRPEFGAERVSYDLPPPTAARGMIEPILWKPEFRYHVLRVAKLPHSSGQPSRFMRLTTNEVRTLTPSDVSRTRTQRRNLILRHAAFLVEVEIVAGARPITKPGHTLSTYVEMLKRRVAAGQCLETPCLGIRDYPASFRLATADDVPVDDTRPLGPMTYIVWGNNWRARTEPASGERRVVTMPTVMMENGVVDMREWQQ